ncbi:Putative ribonuclease H protein At1g65750 [Linum perenne]
MQTASLPLSLCDRIDRKIRNFIWGSSDGVRKIHNVNWETVCKLKNMGGLGLRSARELDMAFLMKVAWSIISKPDELWVKTLVSKYLINNGVGFTLRSSAGYSSLWRGVLRVWNLTLNGLHWNINNGKKTNFWKDRWLDSGLFLSIMLLTYRELIALSQFRIFHYLMVCGILKSCPGAILQVYRMTPPSDQMGEDSFCWGLESNGVFTVKSAYLLIKDLCCSNEDNKWRKIWRWEGPEKIKQFMWLVSHKKLMTNEERRRGHVATIADCPECNCCCEDVEHVLRKCNFAQQVWQEVMPDSVGGPNALSTFEDWWQSGIGNSASCLCFGVVTWLLWRRRNKLIFQSESLSVREVCSQVKF